MEKQETDCITAFDTLYTTNQLQMLKILLPYMQPDMQSYIAVYIKLNELLVALHFSRECSSHSPVSHSKKDLNLSVLICELSPFLNKEEKDMLLKISEMKETMENFQQISQLMQMMEGQDSSPDSILSNFLSEEQISMFKMFQEDLS